DRRPGIHPRDGQRVPPRRALVRGPQYFVDGCMVAPGCAHRARARRTCRRTSGARGAGIARDRDVKRTIVLLLLFSRTARADDGEPGLSYLWDGGAIPFIYVPLAGEL